MNGIQIRLGDILYALLKRWALIVVLTLLGFFFALGINVLNYIRGEIKNYEISCSIAVTAQSSTGNFTGNSAYLNPNDFYLAQDMVDAVTYVMKSDRVLEEAITLADLQLVSASDLSDSLSLSRYNETQIIEITLDWSSDEEGILLMNAILEAAGEILPETLMIGNVATIDQPTAKYFVVGSGYGNLWGFMIALGFLSGVGIAVLDLILKPTLLNLNDVENVLGMDRIGSIPHNEAFFHAKPKLLPVEGPTSKIEQNFSSSAYIIRNLLGSKGKQHIFYVTSTEEGEGKSSVAANVALQLSFMENKVLLLDLDMKNPALGRRFLEDIDYSHSLNSLYKGEVTASEAIIPLNAFLYLLPTVLERNAVQVDQTLFDFIREIAEGFDYVILDAPSLGQESYTLSLGQLADAAVFVIRFDTVSMHEIQRAVEKMDKSGTRVLGCIVNDVKSMGKMNFMTGGETGGTVSGTGRRNPQYPFTNNPPGGNADNKDSVKNSEKGKPGLITPADILKQSSESGASYSDEDALESLMKMGLDGSWKTDTSENARKDGTDKPETDDKQ